MHYLVRYHPLVRKDLSTINTTIKARIKNAIERRLMVDPIKYGDPLRKTLKGYRKVRVGDYRIVYKIEVEYIYIPMCQDCCRV